MRGGERFIRGGEKNESNIFNAAAVRKEGIEEGIEEGIQRKRTDCGRKG